MSTKRNVTAIERFDKVIDNATSEELQEIENELAARIAAREVKREVAPEFLDALSETIGDTLTAALKKIEAPQEVKDLADALYQVTAYFVAATSNKRVGLDELAAVAMVRGVNSVANAGGVFHCSTGTTNARHGALLDMNEVLRQQVFPESA